MSNRTGTDEIWMSNADGTGLVQISKLNNAGTPRWSPDGRRIVFDSRSEGHSGVYIADIAERVPRRLRTNIEEMKQPFWSHDGKWIYFIDGAERIYRCPAEGGAAEALSSQAGAFPQESFGGDKVYFVTNTAGDPALMVISLKKPGSESIVEGIPSVNFANWAVVPKGIYFLPNGKWSLEYFDFTAKKVNHFMELSDEPIMGFSVSQDQRSIVYARLQQADKDIMVVENWR
jgi:Tol biopolymer transport system component